MKNALLTLIAAVLFAGTASPFVSVLPPTFPPAPAPVMDSDISLKVVQNITRTAYYGYYGTYDGFNPDGVSLTPMFGDQDLSAWVPFSPRLRNRLGQLRRAEENDRIFHVWPGLIGMPKAFLRRILETHYFVV